MTHILLALLVLLPGLSATAQDPPPLEPGEFKGSLAVPGQTVEVGVHLARSADAGWTGTLDIPINGVQGMPLTDIKVTNDSLSFVAAAIGSTFTLSPREGGGWSGTMAQRGKNAPFELWRRGLGEAIGPPRPQTPRPPYPYTVRDVSVPNTADDVVLAGTLTLPNGDGPHPGLVLMTGSGPQDRDETLLGHKPFLVLADHLTRAGIAVLRMDDRGISFSSGDRTTATGEDFVRDASAGLDLLASLPEIDATRLGLGGHSEGGGLAPFVAASRDDVSFLVLLAGSVLPGREIMPLQLHAMLKAANVPESLILQQLDLQGRMLDLSIESAPAAELRAVTEELILLQSGMTAMADVPAEARPQFEQSIDAVVAQAQSDWMRTFLTLDARVPLGTLDIPILALNGEFDLQVLPEQNLQAIAAAAVEAGNTQVTTRELPGLNHLFQPTKTGRIEEYGEIEQTFSPDALQIIASWLRQTNGLD